MKLPNGDQAIVDPGKIRDYLLSDVHSVGRFKAAFFASLGITVGNSQLLDSALRGFAREGEIESEELTRYGQKFRIRGRLTGPTGRSGEVISVWIVVGDEVRPRLVTVFPAR